MRLHVSRAVSDSAEVSSRNVYSTCSRHYARESRAELVGGPSLNVFKMFVLTHLHVDGLTIGSARCVSSAEGGYVQTRSPRDDGNNMRRG